MNFVICPYTQLLVAMLIFHQCIEAAFPEETEDRTRALLTYNLDTDLCREVSAYSNNETKRVANKACAMAFHALDRLEGNSCDGWRKPECRLLHGFDHFQCTCLLPASVYVENRNKDVFPFRDCAWKLYTEEVIEGQAPTVSPDFRQRYLQIHIDAVEKARSRRGASPPSGPGSSKVSKRKRTEGDFSGATTSAQGGSASWGVEMPDFTHIPGSPGPSINPVQKRSRNSYIRNPHVCEVCGEEFPVLKDLKKHARSHEPERRCSICNEFFEHKGTLKSHMKRCQREATEPEPVPAARQVFPEVVPIGPYACNICGRSYRHAQSLKTHRKMHEDKTRCTICDEVLSSVQSLRRHKKSAHPEIFEAEKEDEELVRMLEKPFECESCEARFSCESSWRLHQAVHRGETTCSQCNIVFPRKTMLNKHMKNQHS